jgi:hypothetical protein
MASLKASRYNQLILGLAALGSVLALRQKHWLAVYLIVWFGTAFVLLLNHAPVWYHHHLLVTIPAAMLAAYAVHEIIYLLLISACTKTFSPGRAVLFLLFVIVILPVATMQASNLLKFCLVSLQTVHTASYAEMSLAELQPVSLMSHYAGQSQWVVTDRPLYAFRAGLPVPPNFAVISLKRVATGSLTEQDVLDSIRKTSPEQVFLTRFQWPSVEEYLHDHYYILSSISGKPFYLRHDLAQETP